MQLHNISLVQYRNYSQYSIDFTNNRVLIIGNNGIGKSNLLEAIETISFGSILQAEQERNKLQQNIQDSSAIDKFQIKAQYQIQNREYNYKYIGGSTAVRHIELNKVKYNNIRKIRDQQLKTVCFKAKGSLDIIRSTPAVRRNWLDLNIALINIQYADNLRQYKRCLDQKNKLLKLNTQQTISNINDQLDIWDNELAKSGLEIINQRIEFINNIQEELKENYCKISQQQSETVSLEYLPSQFPLASQINNNWQDNLNINYLLEQYQKNRQQEIRRAITLTGCHKDDLIYYINNLEARYYASQGQQRSLALATHLTQLHIWTKHLGYAPILLLDDVCAELDRSRQSALFQYLPNDVQIFITTTHLDNIYNFQGQIIDLGS